MGWPDLIRQPRLNVKKRPEPGHLAILLCKGFCGTSRLQRDFPCVDERVFRDTFNQRKTLKEIAESFRAGEYIPVEGRDFSLSPFVINTPNGVILEFPEISVKGVRSGNVESH